MDWWQCCRLPMDIHPGRLVLVLTQSLLLPNNKLFKIANDFHQQLFGIYFSRSAIGSPYSQIIEWSLVLYQSLMSQDGPTVKNLVIKPKIVLCQLCIFLLFICMNSPHGKRISIKILMPQCYLFLCLIPTTTNVNWPLILIENHYHIFHWYFCLVIALV